MRHEQPEGLGAILSRWFDGATPIMVDSIEDEVMPPGVNILSAWTVGDFDRWLVMSSADEPTGRGGHLFFLVDRAGRAAHRDLPLWRLHQVISHCDDALREMMKHPEWVENAEMRVVIPVDHPSVETDGPRSSLGTLLVTLPDGRGEMSLGLVSGRRSPWEGDFDEDEMGNAVEAIVDLIQDGLAAGPA